MHSRFWLHKTLYVEDISKPGYDELMRRARAVSAAPLDLRRVAWTFLRTPPDNRLKRPRFRRVALWSVAVLTFFLLIAIVNTISVRPATGSLRAAIEAPLEHCVDWR